jgi:hypothetical protein
MSQKSKLKIWTAGIAVLFAAGRISAAIITDGLALQVNAQNVVQSGGQVTKLVDQSGNGLDISYNTTSGTYGGTLNSGALNGHDTLSITNSGFRASIGDSANLNATTDGLTIFLVASLAHTADVDVLKKHTGTTSTDPGYYLKSYDDVGKNFFFWATSSANNRFEMQYDASASPDFFVMAFVIGSGSDTLSSYYDGDNFATVKDLGTLGDASNSANFDIGRNAAGQMDFAELLIYNRLLSSDEWNEVGATLGGKYEINTTYVIPEPFTFGMMGAGMIGLFGLRRMMRL